MLFMRQDKVLVPKRKTKWRDQKGESFEMSQGLVRFPGNGVVRVHFYEQWGWFFLLKEFALHTHVSTNPPSSPELRKCFCCYNKVREVRWFIKHKDPVRPLLKAGKPKSLALASVHAWRGLSPASRHLRGLHIARQSKSGNLGLFLCHRC